MEHTAKATLRPVKSLVEKPREVAIVGFGKSMDRMYDLDPDIPIWSLNAAEDYDFKRLDRIFEMHQIRDIVLETPRFERAQKELSYDLFMLASYREMPSSVRYEIERVLALAFENVYLGDEHAAYMDSTLCYMIAAAVVEGYNVIHIMGFELHSDTEYRYQRPGAAYMIGWAAGKNCRVILPKNSGLLPKTLYGYDDYQSISRQNAEQWLGVMQIEESEWMGKMNTAHAQVIERQRFSILYRLADWIMRNAIRFSRTDIEKAAKKRNEAYQQMYMRQGAITILVEQIKIMDRKRDAMGEIEFIDNYIIYEEGE